jgi:hypothetical protein
LLRQQTFSWKVHWTFALQADWLTGRARPCSPHDLALHGGSAQLRPKETHVENETGE